jgi:hypothetical protein
MRMLRVGSAKGVKVSNYPPGVTGSEPQITGEWPCRVCEGCGYDDDENEDGKHTCGWCKGEGIDPEDPTVEQVQALYDNMPYDAREFVAQMAWVWLDRHDPETRKHLRECIEAVRLPRATDSQINRSFDAYRS